MKYSGLFTIAGILLLPSLAMATEVDQAQRLAKGKAVAFDMAKGNCLACHMMADGELPGNFGPPLVQMKERYPDKALLRQQISDATARNPQSIMPPFGKHGILTEEELDMVLEYVYTL